MRDVFASTIDVVLIAILAKRMTFLGGNHACMYVFLLDAACPVSAFR